MGYEIYIKNVLCDLIDGEFEKNIETEEISSINKRDG